jgi:hypothetical protein
MKFLLITLACFATALLFWFCKSNKYKANSLPEKQLRFGSGGGVVGKEKMFTLLENGQVFVCDVMSKDTTEVAGIRGKKARNLFAQIDSLKLGQLQFQHPGNTYNFIEIMSSGHKPHRIVWGDKTHPIDEKIKTLYSDLMESMQR